MSAKPAKKQGNATLSFVFTKIAEGALALGALLALIFVFFIGAGIKVPEAFSSLVQGEGIELGKSTNIFYFFGAYFKDLKALGDAPLYYDWFNDLLFSQTGLYGALGIAVSALTLLSVVTFSVLAIVFYGLSWTKNCKVDFSKFALGAIVCFFVGALAFYALSSVAVSVNAAEVVSVSISAKLNGATVAGLICVASLLLPYFVFRVLAKGRAGLGFAPIFKTVMSIATVAFAIVVAVVSANQGLTVGVQMSGTEATVTASFLQSNILWLTTFGNSFDKTMSGYETATTALEVSTALLSVAQLTQILTIAFAGVTVMNAFKKGADGKNAKTVLFAALGAGVALLTLVLSCVGYGFFTEAYAFYDADTEIGANFACEIVAFVFSLLTLGGAIAAAIVEKKTK